MNKNNSTNHNSKITFEDLGDNLLQLEDVWIKYDEHISNKNITFTIKQGSLSAIIGPNGGGKSTLIKAIKGINKFHKGQITFHSKLQNQHIAYLSQSSEIDHNFPITVYELIISGFCNDFGFFQKFGNKLHAKALNALNEVGLNAHINRPISMLSGGEFQRVLFARIIIENADLILLDEPFVAIDNKTVKFLMELILKWHNLGKTILVVNHDLTLVEQYFPEVLMINKKVICKGNTNKMMTTKNFQLLFSNLEN